MVLWLPILPLLICLITTIGCFFAWHTALLQKTIHLIGAVVFLIATVWVFFHVEQSGILVLSLGNYPSIIGITLTIDDFSAIMLLVTAIIGLCVSIYALADISSTKQKIGFFPIYWLLLLGVTGAFSTGDIFNLYVWFEVMLIASFILMVLGGHKAQLDGTIKYVAMNLVATLFMLTAIALLYGMVGTLNMADLSIRLAHYSLQNIVSIVVILLGFAFSIKSALFPLFFWLPASYHTTSVSASALFAGLLTKVGVYALIRLLTLIYIPPHVHGILILLICAGFTMFTGVMGAISQYNFRRLLSFHIISQIGYMILGIAIYTPFALGASLFFIVHNIIAKSNLFLISGIVHRLYGNFDVRKLGGIYKNNFFLAILFFIPAFSLAGVPPLTGFWAKLLILKSALDTHHYIIATIGLFTSLFTLFSMTKIWNYAFWKEKEEPLSTKKQQISGWQRLNLMLPVVILAAMTVIIGLWPEPFFKVAELAANQMMNPSIYTQAVMLHA